MRVKTLPSLAGSNNGLAYPPPPPLRHWHCLIGNPRFATSWPPLPRSSYCLNGPQELYKNPTALSQRADIAVTETFDPWGVLVFLKFEQFSSELTKTWSSGATECGVWIGNCNAKVWKSTEHKLHNIWRSLKFCTNWGKRAHPWLPPPPSV